MKCEVSLTAQLFNTIVTSTGYTPRAAGSREFLQKRVKMLINPLTPGPVNSGGTMWKDDTLDPRLSRLFEMSARALLCLFILAILATILAGVIYTFYDLRLIFTKEFHDSFRMILVDMLTVLAMVEILRTALAYFSEGRVKVTYIIDTVLVTILTEILAFWYKDMTWQKLAMAIILIVSLAVVRIVAVRFSPRTIREEF